jgi:O-antigen/teichoic acid export membrane protein
LIISKIRQFKSSTTLIKILKNSGWLLMDKIIRGVFTLLIGAWVARYLGPAQFGKLAFILAYLAFFQAVANLGLDGIVIRDIVRVQHSSELLAQKSLKVGDILGTAFTMRILSGLFCWLTAVFGMCFFSDAHAAILTALAGSILIFQASDTVDLWFQSQSQSKRTVLAKLLAYLISNGLRVLFIVFGMPLIWFAVAMGIEFLIVAIALLYAYKKLPCGDKWVSKTSSLGRALIKQSWPIILSGVSIIIYMRIDQLAIKAFLNEEQLGLYAAVIPFATIWSMIPIIVVNSFTPIITQQKRESESRYLKSLKLIFLTAITFAMLLVGFNMLIGPFIIKAFLGATFLPALSSYRIYSLSLIPVFIGYMHLLWIYNEEDTKVLFVKSLSGGLATFAGCFLLVPNLGLQGAAFGALLGYIVADIVTPVIFRWKFLKKVAKC